MVNAVTAAAGRQARVIAGLKQPSERAEAKEKHQDEGSRAAHLVLMVHEHKDGCVGSFIIVEIRNFSCSKEKQVSEAQGSRKHQEQSHLSPVRRPLRIALFGFGTVAVR